MEIRFNESEVVLLNAYGILTRTPDGDLRCAEDVLKEMSAVGLLKAGNEGFKIASF